MNPADSYRQFCPVAMAAEVFCTRWTPLILRELVSGSTRFNDLRRGMPRISPTLLSKRLKQLEEAGVVRKLRSREDDSIEYRLTPAGEELKAVVFDLGFWGQRWIEAQSSLKNLDPSLLMWDMRRNLDPTPIPPGRSVIQIVYSELQQGKRNWWLVIEDGETDICNIDPGFDVDLHIATDLRTMTAIWMGLTTVSAEEEAGRLHAVGNRTLKRAMQQWLGLSPFATEKKRVPA
jgi:DNA-binding HxlR family transcriptional regulator